MLTDRESEVVRAVLRASVEGPFLPDWEFPTLMGVGRAETGGVLEAWPGVADEEVADAAINNAFNNLLAYAITSGRPGRSTAMLTRTEVARVFARWRSKRGMSRPSTYFEAMS